jgi:hypothetical protein
MSFVIWARQRGIEGNQIRSKRIVVDVGFGCATILALWNRGVHLQQHQLLSAGRHYKKNNRQVGRERFGALTSRSRRERAVVAADRGSQVQANHFSLTANALAISQLAGILAVQAQDAAA